MLLRTSDVVRPFFEAALERSDHTVPAPGGEVVASRSSAAVLQPWSTHIGDTTLREARF